MNTSRTTRNVTALLAAVLVCACQATAPTETGAPTGTHAPGRTAPAIASPSSSSTRQPATTASPVATPSWVAAPPSTAATSPLDGTYATTFTEAELANSPLLYDQLELNDGNWGDWTLTFANGRVSYTQANGLARGGSSGTFAVADDVVRMAFEQGANAGESFAFHWRLVGDTLTFARDETLGPGPTPFLVKPWTRRGPAGTPSSIGRWTPTDSLETAGGSALTLLDDGSVLVAGGQDADGKPLASAERYDPATGKWSPTADLSTPRGIPAAVRLTDGRVLVVGGFATAQGDGERALASAEIYDPATESWSATGSMATARVYQTATLLPTGSVLVAGGTSPSEFLGSAELYDPETGEWTSAGTIPSGLAAATTLLEDGRVLVMGGGTELAQLYEPHLGKWRPTGSMLVSRDGVEAVLLDNGKVLVEGGGHTFGATAEIYDPETGTWSATDPLHQRRDGHTATLLADGRVLVAGGQVADGEPGLTSAEIYDPNDGSWDTAANMNVGRYFASATLLQDGRLLVAGGDHGEQSAEIFAP